MGTIYSVEELTLDFKANYILKNKQVQEKKVCCLPSLFFCQVETFSTPFQKKWVCLASYMSKWKSSPPIQPIVDFHNKNYQKL